MSSGGDLDSDREAEECKTKNDSTSSGSESEDDDQESSSYALGYIPLSQDPDVDDDNEENNCVVTNGDVNVTETSCCTDDDTVRHPKPVEHNSCSPISSIEKSEFSIVYYCCVRVLMVQVKNANNDINSS